MTEDSINNYWMVPTQFVNKESHGFKDFLENYCGYKIEDDNSIRKNSIKIGIFSESSKIVINYNLNNPRQIEEAGRLKKILEINSQTYIENHSREELIRIGKITSPKEETIIIDK